MRGVRVLHDDDDVVVAEKPAGLLTIGTDRERHRTLFRYLFDCELRRRPDGRVFVVHRLDREASGLLVFAKNEQAKISLQGQFRDRTAGRTYNAVVRGAYPCETEVLESYLAQNKALQVYVTPDAWRGKLATTHVKVLKRAQSATLVEVVLKSGRKHQIRVHLAGRGHPLLGDRRYGEDLAGPIGRLALHAVSLEFNHPGSHKRMRFESRLPARFLTPFHK
jgi:23S rRNA pseudouridine1911/1915/1917 synthase